MAHTDDRRHLPVRLRLVSAAAFVAVGLARAAGAAPSTDVTPRPPGGIYVVSESQSRVRVHVGKSGAFSFAGHRHEVAAPVAGTITANPADLAASSVELLFSTPRFRVLPDGEPDGDAPKVEEVMRGPRVLDVARFAELRFHSRRVAGGVAGAATGEPATAAARRYELRITGDLTIHGVTRELVVPMSVVLEGETLKASGRSTIRHDQFALTPVTAGGGTVRVSNEIEIDFAIVASRRQ
jgi:polyisoprenoid-binding protein YceI